MFFCPFISFILKEDKRQGVPSNRIKRQQEERNRKPVTFVNCSLLTALRATGSEGEAAERREGPTTKSKCRGAGGRRPEQHMTPFLSHCPLILKLDSNGALIQHKKVLL